MKILASNKQARHEYFLEMFFECGMVLEGWEVKAILSGKISLSEAYVRVIKEEVFLIGCTVSPTGSNSTLVSVDKMRSRKLLLHGSEITKLVGKTQIAGMTLVPMQVYYKDRRIKIEIALAKGKKQHDKREATKIKDIDRELRRNIKADR